MSEATLGEILAQALVDSSYENLEAQLKRLERVFQDVDRARAEYNRRKNDLKRLKS